MILLCVRSSIWRGEKEGRRRYVKKQVAKEVGMFLLRRRGGRCYRLAGKPRLE
jgi:hypothetical protein